MPVVPPAIQVAAPLVLSDEGHQGGEHVRHGAGRLSQHRPVSHLAPGPSSVMLSLARSRVLKVVVSSTSTQRGAET